MTEQQALEYQVRHAHQTLLEVAEWFASIALALMAIHR